MKRFVRCADDLTEQDILTDKLKGVKSDFDFICDGIDILVNHSQLDKASEIAESLSVAIADNLSALSELLAGYDFVEQEDL